MNTPFFFLNKSFRVRIYILCSLFVSIFSYSFAAEGDVLWSVASNPSNEKERAVAIEVDNSGVYVAGNDKSLGGNNSQWRVEKRSLDDGSLLWFQEINFSNGDDYMKDMALDTTGIYLVGSRPKLSITGGKVQKRDLTGELVLWSINLSGNLNSANSVEVDASGVYVGSVEYGARTLLSAPFVLRDEVMIRKYNSTNGQPIWSAMEGLVSNGATSVKIALGADRVYVIDQRTYDFLDDYIIVSEGLANWDFNEVWAVYAHDTTTGALLSEQIAYYPSGKFRLGPSAVTLDAGGLYTAGNIIRDTNTDGWGLQKRSLTNFGSTLWQVEVNYPMEELSDSLLTAKIKDGHIYLGGGDHPGGDYQFRLEKRDAQSGALVWTKTEDISSGADDVITDIALHSSGIYIAGYDSLPSNEKDQWRIQKRAIADPAVNIFFSQ
jgi:hypothetical protein